MNVVDRPAGRPPLSPREGWISDGRQVLHFKPLRYDRWSQALEVTLGELMVGGEPPLLKKRKELTREQAIRLWAQKRQQGWQPVNPSGCRRPPPQSVDSVQPRDPVICGNSSSAALWRDRLSDQRSWLRAQGCSLGSNRASASRASRAPAAV